MAMTKLAENLVGIQSQIRSLTQGLVKANELILEAIKECKVEKFDEAKATIKNVNSKADEIDNSIIRTLALCSPGARDLRELVAYLKMTNELSRATSSTRGFIRGFVDVCKDLDKNILNEYVLPMQESTLKALKSVDSMIDIDDEDEIRDVYNDVLIQESKTDDLYEMLERTLSKQKDNIEKTRKVLKALRKSDKIASRSISIANLFVYAKVGGSLHN